jgi:hypothetical protein
MALTAAAAAARISSAAFASTSAQVRPRGYTLHISALLPLVEHLFQGIDAR